MRPSPTAEQTELDCRDVLRRLIRERDSTVQARIDAALCWAIEPHNDPPGSEGMAETQPFIHARIAVRVAREKHALEQASEELEDYDHLIALQHSRVVLADKAWRRAHPGNDDVMPDLGALVEWLMSFVPAELRAEPVPQEETGEP